MRQYGKRAAALLLALCMALGLAACGGNDDEQLSGTIYVPK